MVSQRLQELKSDTREARKYWQLTRAEEDRKNYTELKCKYRDEIKRAKGAYLVEEIDAQIEADPWHRAWGRVKRPGTIKRESNLRMEDGTYTKNEEETNRYLINKYFLKDTEEEDNEKMTSIEKMQAAIKKGMHRTEDMCGGSAQYSEKTKETKSHGRG